jgi:two-component system chemotaxis response regulator CheB
MSEIQVVKRREYPTIKNTKQLLLERPDDIRIFIGASTGGPTILSQILKNLPASFPYPILVAQHMASTFVDNFATWLDSQTRMQVKIADEMEYPVPGTIYVPPMNTHIGLYPSRQIRLIPQMDEKKVCPSVDLLFSDASRYIKEKAIGIILTGMGKDGAEGIKMIHSQHGLTIAQEEKSCVVFGMPAAAIKNQAVDFIFTPTEIAHYLFDLANDPARIG